MKFFIVILPLFLFAQGNYSFGPSIQVSDNPIGMYNRYTTQRSIACRSDTIYIVWRDDRYGGPLDYNAKIFFSKSTDGGNTWSPNLMVSQNWDSLGFFMPHMAIDGSGNIYVAYCSQSDNDNDRDIYFTKSSDEGNSFTIPIMVNDSSVVPWQTFCACAVDSTGQNVYVAWEDSRNSQNGEDIYLGRSTDGGASFLPSLRVNDDFGNYRQWVPVVACNNSGQNIYVAWQDFRDTLYGANVYFTYSTDYGQTFAPNYCVNDTTTTGISKQGNPTIWFKNGVIYLAWRDERNKYYLYFNKSINGGISFETDIPIRDDTLGAGIDPSITADDSGKVFITWFDTRTISTTGYDIYFSYSTDSGMTFQPNVRVNDLLGNVSAWDQNPSIAVNQSGKVFIAWDSDRNDPSHAYEDVYFAAGEYVGIQDAVINKINNMQLIIQPTVFRISVKINIHASSLDKNQCKISIYDIGGRSIRQFSHNVLKSISSIIWDGRDNAGNIVSAGTYFVILEANNKIIQSVKTIKIK